MTLLQAHHHSLETSSRTNSSEITSLYPSDDSLRYEPFSFLSILPSEIPPEEPIYAPPSDSGDSPSADTPSLPPSFQSKMSSDEPTSVPPSNNSDSISDTP